MADGRLVGAFLSANKIEHVVDLVRERSAQRTDLAIVLRGFVGRSVSVDVRAADTIEFIKSRVRTMLKLPIER
jgi:hypothetical protein